MKKILRIMTPIVVLGLVCTPVIALSATSCKDKTDDATTLRTLLIYMCASDLESDWALATFNIDQMLITDLSASSINIILETGGTTE
ncbi:hypothetical protein FACS1894166_07540 [Bacilli bacterium]|nr:hypothetical protein FACS1894166_07540 [Bacilli bacterium]